MQNIKATVDEEHGILYLEIDLGVRLHKSRSGRTTLVASTVGPVHIPDTHEDMKVNLTAWVK